MNDGTYRINNRELSWLSFNERVLMEAQDPTNPLLERLKFVAIFGSNLDEFFMVRVSGVHDRIDIEPDKPDFSGFTPKQLMDEISVSTKRLSALQQSVFTRLKHELEEEQIHFPDPSDKFFKDTLESIFLDEIMPVISPVTIDPSHPFPFIYSRRICIIVALMRGGQEFTSLVTIPETLRRIYKVRKSKSVYVFMVEDIIRQHLHLILKGYEIKNVGLFRVTRDADLELAEEKSANLIHSLEHSLSQRKKGDVHRAEVSGDISAESLEFLQKMVGFTDDKVHRVKGIIDLTFLFALSNLRESLLFTPLVQRSLPRLADTEDIFQLIKEKPIYFFRPYNPFSVVSDLVERAAKDDDVLAIKMTLYRTNKNSRIVASLLEAARRGKQVSVVVELRARFDEERNIEWAKNLEEAGCIVTYGIVGLKIHAKCMLIVRREENKIVRYTHIATGNYNENTSTVYTDIDMITADEAIGRDATQLFNYLMGFTEEENWTVLRVAPFSLRESVVNMINHEIAFAKKGESAHIIMKVNSFIDEDIINKLYDASQAGVKIDLIVRGVCGVKAGIAGLSENIRVRSIVGRFLEHARILYFKHGGADTYFITSADMMPRNLDRRVELMAEITDLDMKSSLENFLRVSLADNKKAWEQHDDIYTKVLPAAGEEEINSQTYFLENEC